MGKTTNWRSKRIGWNCSPSPGEKNTNTSLYWRVSPELDDQFVPNSSRVQNNIKKTMILNSNYTVTNTIIFPTTSWSSWRMVLLAFLALFFISTVPSTEASMDRWPYLGRYCVGRAGCETDFQDMIFNVSFFVKFIGGIHLHPLTDESSIMDSTLICGQGFCSFFAESRNKQMSHSLNP